MNVQDFGIFPSDIFAIRLLLRLLDFFYDISVFRFFVIGNTVPIKYRHFSK